MRHAKADAEWLRRGGKGGTAYEGYKRRDGGRDTPSVCESSRYRRALSNNDTCIILCTPTPWCKQHPRVLSPSVAPPNPLGAPAPSSEGAEGAPAPCTGLPLWHNSIKMCRHGRQTFIFHAPEGCASCAEGTLHTPKACFISRYTSPSPLLSSHSL